MALRLHFPLQPRIIAPIQSNKPIRIGKFCVRSHALDSNNEHKMVLEVKEKLEKDYHNLPVGRNGRDDEDMILWFLKDRKFSVRDAVSKLTKAIRWRQEFGVSQLSEESVKSVAETGKSYVHDFVDVCGRPVLIVEVSKHFPEMVLEVKEKLEKDYHNLPVGRNGRDDEDMILWFLKDRKFSVRDAVSKLTKAIRWRQEFGVSQLSEESVKSVAETGKSYVHDFVDVCGRPVLIVEVSKHFPEMQDPYEDEKLCVFLIEKALSRLPAGKQDILAIIDLRGFGTENADIKFLTFLFDVFYYYYPRRLGEVLFVEAPFLFKPVWQLAKPMLKSYASLVIIFYFVTSVFFPLCSLTVNYFHLYL
ncbi:unnamed protein product [Ilex paraguariensis]|uniref:CRAL-TRIO domain-containing protein n=1 Tax=Ilex paraguariensis TaxID=185542 RepID=A0ABC8R0Q0_9AQUA